MNVTIGHIQLQQDIERIRRAALVPITITYSRSRRSHRIDARTEDDAAAFTEAAERIGLSDVIGA